MKRIAIIGAGLSGVTIAKKLLPKTDTHLFEKSRGVGGRMSTRYAETFVFDHGAPYWKAKTQEFQNFLIPLMGSVVDKWDGFVLTLDKNNPEIKIMSASSYFVAIPNMNSLCKYIASGLNIKTECEVTKINQTNEKKWRLIGSKDQDLGLYDIVISTAPAMQTEKIFGDAGNKKYEIYQPAFESCFALMVGVNKLWNKKWIAAEIHNSPIKWIGVNSTKPGRNHNLSCLVIHSDPNWTKANLLRDPGEIQDILLNELGSLISIDINDLSYISTHRWLYSRFFSINSNDCYFDLGGGLYVVGDWLQMSDIETVWLNAEKAADFVASKI